MGDLKGVRWVRDGRTLIRMALAVAALAVGVSSTLTAMKATPASTLGADRAPAATRADTATVVASIPPGTQGVGILEPLTVTAKQGTLTSVAVTGPGGQPLAGTMSPDRSTWVSAPLTFNSAYTVSAAAVGTDGRPAPPFTSNFHTLKPASTLAVRATRPSNGQVVGVGMPISIYFNRPVTDRAAVERQLRVETSVPVVGSFHWVDNEQVNWRPQVFWPAGTKVNVISSLRGVDAGRGTFGSADHSMSFAIGRHQEALGDAGKHTLTLFQDGKVINTFPASFGRPQYPTQFGMHVAFEKHLTKRMRSDSWGGPEEGEEGFYDEVLPLAVRISGNGEFVHVNGATVRQQGRSNVSHGCVNLSPANGKIFYDWVQIGDPVNIVGTSKPLTKADGDIPDWLMSWEEYQAGSALRTASPAQAPPPAGPQNAAVVAPAPG